MDGPTVVVGAGVVGLACAAELARRGREVLVLEAGPRFGEGVSSRNSEVLHGGMYYPPGSLRARFCVEGRRRLYRFCEAAGVAHRRTGKLIVATSAAEDAELQRLHARGESNGVEALTRLTGAQARALEPALRCTEALLSPETGVVDSHGLMLALLGVAEAHGGVLALRAPVRAVERRPGGGFRVRVEGDEPCTVDAAEVVNAAGLGAQALAAAVETRGAAPPPLTPVKGSYFSCAGRPAFARLIYPVPVEGGLGVHLTLDLAGRMRFGPDVEWGPVRSLDVDPARGDAFYDAVRRYWPGLPDGALRPDYAGVRPKLSGRGEPAADFVLHGPEQTGEAGLVQLFGIESPGLTSCLSLAEAAADLLDGRPGAPTPAPA